MQWIYLICHSWMVSSPGLGPIKSQLWAVLWTLWLIRFLSVSYMSASPMRNLYQVLLSTYMSCCIFLCLFWFRNTLLITLAPLTALVICRDIGLIAAVFWVRYKTVPPPVRHTLVNFEFSLLGVPWVKWKKMCTWRSSSLSPAGDP